MDHAECKNCGYIEIPEIEIECYEDGYRFICPICGDLNDIIHSAGPRVPITGTFHPVDKELDDLDADMIY